MLTVLPLKTKGIVPIVVSGNEVALHKKSSSRKLERSASEHANRPKTKFVSSGLGFKTSQAFSPKGSAKAMLAKIMNDFDG